MYTLIDKLNRKKYLSFDTSPLPRVLTLLDLTTLGIGSTVGVGFYILAGQVARNTAGPAVSICFLIAAIASIFSGLCYAEFGARVPKAGSAYIYSYVCVGEFIAFIIGWNLILEYVIGTASVAKGYSAYVDDLANNSISEVFRKFLPLNSPGLSPYADFFAFSMIFIIMCIHMVGVKQSTTVNNIFTAVNSFVIIFVIIAGATQADVTNWNLSEEDITNGSVCSVPKNSSSSPWGSGGFSPYGFDGIMQGAATCFFGFVGFDVIATTGEEALKPERNIPLAIAISLSFIFLAYLGLSSVLTLALPYCMLDPDAPLIEMFEMKGMMISRWIVSIGAIFGFSASLVGAMFPMPRIIYAMANDGLLFRPLALVNKRFKTPILSTFLSGMFAGIMALLFSLDALVDMMSIGTLMAYTIVALCVMLLSGHMWCDLWSLFYSFDLLFEAAWGFFRYQDRDSGPLVSSEYLLLKYIPEGETDSTSIFKNSTSNQKKLNQHSGLEYVKQLINPNSLREPTELTTSLVNYTTLIFCLLCFLLALFITIFASHLKNMDMGVIVLVVVLFALTMLSVLFISLQPPSMKKLHFKVPLVPWIPALSVFINLYLMCNLTSSTWIRFSVWMFIGLSIYFLYAMKHSTGYVVPAELTRDMRKSSLIPTICIHPPTPWDSLKGNPIATIRHPIPKRTSIIDIVLTSKEFGDAETTKVPNGIIDVLGTFCSADIGSSPPDSEIRDTTTTRSSSEGNDQLDHSQPFAPPLPSIPSDFEKKVQNDNKTLREEDRQTIDSSNAEMTDEHDRVKEMAPKSKAAPIWTTLFHPTDSNTAVRPPPVTSPVSLIASTVSNSEPTTPRPSRNPSKPLSRASSFDRIPPSSIDSPFARRVKKFTIIPVRVPQVVETDDAVTGWNSPFGSSHASAVTCIDLNGRLLELQCHLNASEQIEVKPTLAVDLLSSPILDPIRERGESKVQQADISLVNDRFGATNSFNKKRHSIGSVASSASKASD